MAYSPSIMGKNSINIRVARAQSVIWKIISKINTRNRSDMPKLRMPQRDKASPIRIRIILVAESSMLIFPFLCAKLTR
jgi:hypothetical protein